jgi:hypothetical protein
MRGALIGACNCDWGCPCNFDAPPTYGGCDGAYAVVVGEGSYGELSLDGLIYVWGGSSPGAIHEGNGTGLLIVDEGALPDQRSALETLAAGGGVGEPFDIFASVTTTQLETITAPIEVELDGIRSRVRAAGGEVVDLAVARIRNPVTAEEEEIYLDKPTGFTSTHSELGMSIVAAVTSPGLRFDVSGKYAEFAEFEWSGP